MNLRFVFVSTLMILNGIATFAAAQEGSEKKSVAPSMESPLAIGDLCPALKVERFLKGEPIDEFQRGHVYVVEFWAMWCAPCLQSMPHLSSLQEKYKDQKVTVIGINIREMRQKGRVWYDAFDKEMEEQVESFVEAQGDRMAFSVAYDGKSKTMDKAWMGEDRGMPTTFIVDREGRMAWLGHPMVLRMPLDEIVKGTWDYKSGPARVKAANDTYIQAMKLIESEGEAGLLAWNQAEKKYPILAKDLIGPKFDALIRAGLSEPAYAVGESLYEEAAKTGNASRLNRLAWAIVDPGANLEPRNLDLALKAAKKANELTNGKDAGVLDTLARVHFSRGQVETAIEIQTRAIELASGQMKQALRQTLKEYKSSDSNGER